jgi:HK97 family phage prohead protease
MERKAFATEFKVAGDGRTVEGYASTFGNVDYVGDVVMPGAYKRTLDHRLSRIKVLRDHEHPIGKPIEAYEDSKGLYTKSFISDTALGNETLTLLRDGVLDRMSIGYEPVTKEHGQKDGQSVRFLKEIKLYEWSVVTFPANDSAAVTAVKSFEDLNQAYQEFRAGRLSPQDLAALFATWHKAAPEPAPLDAPANPPPASDPDTSDSAALLAEIKAMMGDFRTHFRRAA